MFRGFFGYFRVFLPSVTNFVSKGSSLGVVLGSLFPLLSQSIDWFEGLLSERRAISEVRSSELEIGLLSNDNLVGVEVDTVVSVPREVRAFHAFGEACGLDDKMLSRFRDRFQFPEWVKVRLPQEKERACHFLLGEVCFHEAAFQCGLRLLIHPFIMELLDRFGIAPGQLMPHSWRIVVSCMEIWLVAIEGDMIRVDELVYLYRLKDSKEHGYYELVPWERRTRIVRDLPSSFRYWKSRFFFVSGDDWETPSSEVWGDLPRLLRWWGTPRLGASLFLFALCSSFGFVYSIIANFWGSLCN